MRFSPRRCLLAILLCLVVCVLLGIYLAKEEEVNQGHVQKHAERLYEEGILLQKLKPAPIFHHGSSDKRDSDQGNKILSSKQRVVPSMIKNVIQIPMVVDNATLRRLKQQYPVTSKQIPCYNVHIFYYTWYGNPQMDDKYYHWDHPFLPHWNKKEKVKWRLGRHEPPEDIGSNFYPKLGPYSSMDRDVIAQHLVQMRAASIGVLSLSWYPSNLSDDQGKPTDSLVPVVLDIANVYDIKVNFHIEPYKDRNPRNVRENIQYILDNYGGHPAFYRRRHKGRLLPVFYIYDSYTISADDWGTILKPQGLNTVRDTDLDGLFIGLLVDKQHEVDIVSGGFDGFYTYFASNRFTFGSSWGNWPHLATFARARDLLFVPSVGPGYIDTEVRPWNGANIKSRDRGRYYESGFKAAIGATPSIITITSFNEWHEGSQIEPAVIKKRGKENYLNYTPGRPEYYLDLTQKFVKRFQQQKTGELAKIHA